MSMRRMTREVLSTMLLAFALGRVPAPAEAEICGAPAPDQRRCSVGEPVNVHTGNVWFDHQDIAIPGRGGTIALSRSYNSRNAYEGYKGSLGRGWTHLYEQLLTPASQEHMLALRQGNGTT